MAAKHLQIFLTVALLVLAEKFCYCQKQLLLVRGEKVMARFNAGDEFVISLKGNKAKMKSYVNNLFDTAVLVHRTLVPLHKIDKIYFKRSGLVNLIGKFLVAGGVGYFLIDQFNVIVVDGNKASLDDNVTAVSATMVAVGLPMLLIKKTSHRIGRRIKVMVVDERSPFYLAPLTHMEQ